MDKVLVVGLLIVAGVITTSILAVSFRSSIEDSQGVTSGLQQSASEAVQTGLTIVEIIPGSNGSEVDLWIKNIGTVDIYPLKNLQLFQIDIQGDRGGYLRYSDQGPAAMEDTWTILGSNAGDDRLEPGETMQIHADLFRNPLTTGEYIFSVGSPNDVQANYRFTADPVDPLPAQPPTPTAPPTLPTPIPPQTQAPTETPTQIPTTPSPGCNPEPGDATPVLRAIQANEGYPRQLLAVDGDTTGASIIWGAGTATESVINNGTNGTQYFQIPEDAGAGQYPVALRVGGNTSNTLCVTVRAASGAYPAPRIQEIGLNGRTGTDLAFTVSAANLDTDASVTVNGTDIPGAALWSALPVDYQLSHIPETFKYPIYHYGQLIGVIPNPSLGSTLSVTVTNRDGQNSTMDYILPGRWEDLDSDNDGLLDRWEDDVYTAEGGGVVNLSGMGADKYKKDIFMEADWTPTAAPGSPGVGYDDSTFEIMKRFFADAPVMNPDGSTGISLTTDYGQGGMFTGGGEMQTFWGGTEIGFQICGAGNGGCGGFDNIVELKNVNFSPDRRGIFKYLGMSENTARGGCGGEARFPWPPPSPGSPELGGDNLIAAVIGCGWNNNTDFAYLVVHEIGHTIGLSHGGTYLYWNHSNWKANFHSLMNYRYMDSLPACELTGPGEANFRGGPDPISFSSGILNDLDESFIDENIGICDNSPSDLSGDGRITAGPQDLQEYRNWPDWSTTVHEDVDQWGNVVLDFNACWTWPVDISGTRAWRKSWSC